MPLGPSGLEFSANSLPLTLKPILQCIECMSCGHAGNMSTQVGYDFYGNDYAASIQPDAASCEAMCIVDPTCQAFTYNGNTGVLSENSSPLLASVLMQSEAASSALHVLQPFHLGKASSHC